jgi:hypothetical protein
MDVKVKIEALRQTMLEATTACNEALPDRIRSSGGVCQVSLEIGSTGHVADKLCVVLTLDGGYHNAIVVRQPNELDIVRQATDCMGLLKDWFDAGDFGHRVGRPGVRLRRPA